MNMIHRYYTMSRYVQEKYGQKMRKICIDGGFTCPNRDGTCGIGGCTFCGARGAGEQLDASKTIREQAEEVLAKAKPDSKWILYFQNFTNTYAPVSVLRERYDAALIDPRIRILDIGTRPDCISSEVCALLAEYAQTYEVWTELGLQTANDRTAAVINRGYRLDRFLDAVQMLKAHGLPVIVHIILGLPGETLSDIRRTVDILNALHIDGIKIHSLFIMRNTALAKQYQRGDFTPISMQTYIAWAIDVLTRLSPDIVVHRVTGNCLRTELLAPDWILQRDLMILSIDRQMEAEGLSQGCRYREGENTPLVYSEKNTIIFDLDGTLLNTLDDLRTGVNLALRKYGYPERTLAEVRQFVGNGLATLVARALPDGRENPDYDAVLAETRAQYAAHREDTTAPYAGIIEMLDALIAAGYRLGVVSNKPDIHTKALCQAHFGSRIAAAVGAKDGVPLKPAPDSVLECMAQLHADSAHTVYIGDSEVDLETARNAGIPCISVLWGFRDADQLKQAGSCIFVHEPNEIVSIFRNNQ